MTLDIVECNLAASIMADVDATEDGPVLKAKCDRISRFLSLAANRGGLALREPEQADSARFLWDFAQQAERNKAERWPEALGEPSADLRALIAECERAKVTVKEAGSQNLQMTGDLFWVFQVLNKVIAALSQRREQP